MITQFSGLNQEESDMMVDAISLVTVLISGADGKIDQGEKDWSAKLTKIRSYNNPESWNAYYRAVGENYSEKLDALIEGLPGDTDERSEVIADRLSSLNDILPKLEPWDAYDFYKGLVSFAGHVAKASGGFLRMGSVSQAEKKWMSLPMINPVEKPKEDDEA